MTSIIGQPDNLVFAFLDEVSSNTVHCFKVVQKFSVISQKRVALAMKECKQEMSSRSRLQIFYKLFVSFALSRLNGPFKLTRPDSISIRSLAVLFLTPKSALIRE